MTWYHDGNEFTQEDAEDYEGFVYVITCLDTGRRYIGKKILKRKVTRPPLKGKKNKRRSKEVSDWETYYGSSEDLLADVAKLGTNKFKREVVRLCRTRGEMSYFEAKLIFETDAIVSDAYYNSWVSVKVHRSTLRHLFLKNVDRKK